MFLIVMQFVFILSFGIILFILANKIPILADLPIQENNLEKSDIGRKVKTKIKKIPSVVKRNLKDMKDDIGKSLQDLDDVTKDKKEEIDEDGDYWTKLRE